MCCKATVQYMRSFLKQITPELSDKIDTMKPKQLYRKLQLTIHPDKHPDNEFKYNIKGLNSYNEKCKW